MSEDRGKDPQRPATERAEELLNRAGWTVGLFASMLGTRLARVAAFALEEAEDMWAEAQNVRQQSSESLGATAGRVAGATRGEAEGQKAEPKQEVEPDGETGTGTATAEASPSAEERELESEQGAEPEGADSIKATDAARRRAEELGVDLREVEGTGARGQITASDVKKKAQAKS